MEEAVSPIVEDINQKVIPSAEKIANIQSTLQSVKEPFVHLSTEYQQMQYAINKGALVQPRGETLGYIINPVLDHDSLRTQQKRVPETFQYTPINENLKVFLETPGCISSILEYKQKVSDNDVLESFQDGAYYKQCNQEKEGEITIELLLYTDEFETANPLGPRKGKHKLLAVHMTLLCLPPKYQAKLENILLVALAKSSLVSKYGIDSIFSPIVHDLESLYATGIHIKCGRHAVFVKPKLFQIIGDNLEMNTSLGYAGSFSANFFCRSCKTIKQVTFTQVVEDQDTLRTLENIEDDLRQENLTKTGVARSSIFNTLSYFHVADNASFDIMHDFLEGLLPIKLKLLLDELIRYQDLFTLDLLNSRILCFSYGKTDQKNKPCPILPGQLNNPFSASGQSASQMQCLALFMPLIIGDKVAHDSQCWELFLILLEIYKIVCAPSISVAGTYYLKGKIKEHHTLFLELFPDHHLIPKAHNIIHYPRAIRLLGPLRQYTCMRLEGKHHPLKQWAKTCCNYRNIAKTLATKHQQGQGYNHMRKEAMKSTSIEIQSKEVIPASILDHGDTICNLLECHLDANLILCKSAIVNGHCYRPNIMLLSDWTDELPTFCKVVQMVELRSDLYLILQPWNTLYFEDHYHAYAVEENATQTFQIKKPHDIMEHRPVHAVKSYTSSDHKWYIATRYSLV